VRGGIDLWSEIIDASAPGIEDAERSPRFRLPFMNRRSFLTTAATAAAASTLANLHAASNGKAHDRDRMHFAVRAAGMKAHALVELCGQRVEVECAVRRRTRTAGVAGRSLSQISEGQSSMPPGSSSTAAA